MADRAYSKAIIMGYSKAKLSKGKSLEQVDKKLHELGRAIIANKLGPFVEEIQEVRDLLWKRGDASGSVASSSSATIQQNGPSPPYWSPDQKFIHEKS
ncbi:hypothetical protein BDY24DRAFT_391116 [Mrakia frigida]|uniref:uncharacterized protein n=1 Tax=Mrakia frigida TaxID=29902 RepID=UPI003FCC09E4